MKKILGFLTIIVVLVSSIFLVNKINKDKKQKEELRKIEEKRIEENKKIEKINLIKSHYNNYVIINKDSKIYDEKENEIGIIYKDTKVILEEQDININTKYFFNKNIGYIPYENVDSIEEFSVDDRYLNYNKFNKSLTTKNNYTVYDSEGNKKYLFNNSNSYEIIINDYDNKFYFELNNELVYVLKDDVQKIETNNNKIINAKAVTTLCYHRVYDVNDKPGSEQLYKSKANFEREMKYLNDSNFLALTMEELYLYLNNKLLIPVNSVVITLDDGKMLKSAIEILEKYKLHATTFIITGSFTDYENIKSDYLELQSHTDNMHKTGVCPTQYDYQQGGGLLCKSENEIISDLQTSSKKLNGAFAIAYPFYDYNQRSISLVQKAGYKLGFIGVYNTEGRSKPGTNNYMVPRMTIWNSTTLEEFKKIVKN